jgi:hypothetical protein
VEHEKVWAEYWMFRVYRFILYELGVKSSKAVFNLLSAGKLPVSLRG